MRFHVIVDRYTEAFEFGGAVLVGQTELSIEARDERQAELLLEGVNFNCDIAIPNFYKVN